MAQLADALANLKEDEVSKLLQEQIDAGVDSMSLLNELREGMDIVGERYKSGDYFLCELIVSGEIFKNSMKVVEPLLKAGNQAEKSTEIVLGTVKGDIHNIGKDIVAILLKAAGFEVYDLGIDVSPSAFVDKLKETGAPILAMSGLLTTTITSFPTVIGALEKVALKNKVKVMIGGAPVTREFADEIGAKGFALSGEGKCEALYKLRQV